jgi:cyclophilin family peptidyl-prolyl cis-trans isomerase
MPTLINLDTSLGQIVLELDEVAAPISTANFLSYVDSGHYDGTIFHRVIENFMIQGGGFTAKMDQKPTGKPIATWST